MFWPCNATGPSISRSWRCSFDQWLQYIFLSCLLSSIHAWSLVLMTKWHVALQTNGRDQFCLSGFGSLDSQNPLFPPCFHPEFTIYRHVVFSNRTIEIRFSFPGFENLNSQLSSFLCFFPECCNRSTRSIDVCPPTYTRSSAPSGIWPFNQIGRFISRKQINGQILSLHSSFHYSIRRLGLNQSLRWTVVGTLPFGTSGFQLFQLRLSFHCVMINVWEYTRSDLSNRMTLFLTDVVCHTSLLTWSTDVISHMSFADMLYHMSLRTRFVDVIYWRRSPWSNVHRMFSISDGPYSFRISGSLDFRFFKSQTEKSEVRFLGSLTSSHLYTQTKCCSSIMVLDRWLDLSAMHLFYLILSFHLEWSNSWQKFA
jgi:hypothetical protein